MVRWSKWGVAALVVLIGLGALYGTAGQPEPAPTLSLVTLATPSPVALATPTEVAPEVPTATVMPSIVVYVSGAVQRPGVYELQATARINDAIAAAGGPTADADPARINLAAHMADAQHIYVPTQAEMLAAPPPEPTPALAEPTAQAATAPETGLVNINTAGAAELEALPKIGPATAQRILDYRAANGPFASIDDLQQVKGIGPATFATLAPLITVGP